MKISMNRALGAWTSALNVLCVAGFAAGMLTGFLYGSYVTSIGIALSLVGMACAFAADAPAERRAAGLCGVAFGGMYALCNTAINFTQMTTVRHGTLSATADALLNYQRFGLAFNLDLLGYGLMALSTFFTGLALVAETRADRWLRGLLMVHGAFAPACFVMPMLGLFHEGMAGSDWIGTVALLGWCAYFIPIGVLSVMHFARGSRGAAAR